MTHEMTYDVIVVGGGPAGLTAAIYTSREMLKTLVLEKNMCGGLAATTDLIENYPGFPEGVNGMELVDKFKKQAQRFGTEVIETKEVKKIRPANGKVEIQTDSQTYTAHAVIIASGSVPKMLNVPGEEKFRGKGVSYCATCDGPLYRGKDVAVIGCGNSGLQEGEALLRHAGNVTFVEFLPHMTAEKILQERSQKSKKTRFLLNHELVSIDGGDNVDSITVRDRQTGKEKKIGVSGVFIYIGYLPNSEFLKGVVEMDDSGYVKTDGSMRTSAPGIYAAGDIRSKSVRQIDVACGEATIAAVSLRDYLRK